jgi:hypothetical protein
MAHEKEIRENEVVVILTRQEAADLIGLLTAQLAGVALTGNMGGACPEIVITRAPWPTKMVALAVEKA